MTRLTAGTSAAVAIARHGVRVWRSGQTRFRLETFGLYYPHLPYRKRAWQVTPAYLVLLLVRLPSYLRWVVEMDRLRREGSREWWERHGGSLRDVE
jgi:hypothetical protein